MTADPFTVLGVAGSLRRSSFNRALLEHAALVAPDGVVVDRFDGLGDIPHFNQDLEGDRTPEEVLRFRDRIGAADALLVVAPEYNSAMPGVLKNALDWASRPPGESVLGGKPAAVMGASPGRFGARRAQEQVRTVLSAIGAEVLDRELPVSKVHEVLDGDGAVTDGGVSSQVRSLLAGLVELAGGPAPTGLVDSAAYSRACQERAAAAG
jgi:chromate reductase